jgi:hypothetical protein
MTGQAWSERQQLLQRTMPGFEGLIRAVQGLLIGVSLATDEVWVTPDVATTIAIARGQLQEIHDLTSDWGVEQ